MTIMEKRQILILLLEKLNRKLVFLQITNIDYKEIHKRYCIIIMRSSSDDSIYDEIFEEPLELERKLYVELIYQPDFRNYDSPPDRNPKAKQKNKGIQTLYFLYPKNCSEKYEVDNDIFAPCNF